MPGTVDVLDFIMHFRNGRLLPRPKQIRFLLFEIVVEKSAVSVSGRFFSGSHFAQLSGAKLSQQFMDSVSIMLPLVCKPRFVNQGDQQRQRCPCDLKRSRARKATAENGQLLEGTLLLQVELAPGDS